MINPGWRLWALALLGSIAVHAALTIGVRAPKDGLQEKPAGTPVSVSGSLASILGSQNSEPVEAEDTPSAVEPIKEQEVVPPTADPSPPTETAKPTRSIEPQPSQAEPLAARSSSEAPVAASVVSEPVEVTSLSPQPAEPVKSPKQKPVEQAEESKQKAEKEARKRREAEQKRRRERAKRAKEQQRKKREKAKRQRRAAARSRAGSKHQGAAGTTRGGKGGRSRASSGAVRSYGARIRARILANRPSASGSGRAVVSFGVSTGGGLRYARIARSSGSSSLDRAALSAVRRSSPFPRPPSGSRAGQLRFSISFNFR